MASVVNVVDPAMTCCPVCGGVSQSLVPVRGWGEMRCCKDCGLVFANPLSSSVGAKELFSKAYAGQVEDGDSLEFSYRLKHIRGIFINTPERGFGSPLFRLALDWIDHNLPAGCTVLDIGSGLGFFLHALRRRGFRAIGIEPGEVPAKVLQREGFEVWHGTIDDYPFSWPEPCAVTSFYVLHHVADPVGFLSTISRRFPSAPLLLAESNIAVPRTYVTPGFFPPRTLTWWPQLALERALQRAGYRGTVTMVPLHNVGVHRLTRAFDLVGGRYRLRCLFLVYLRWRSVVLFPVFLWRRITGRGVLPHMFAVGTAKRQP